MHVLFNDSAPLITQMGSRTWRTDFDKGCCSTRSCSALKEPSSSVTHSACRDLLELPLGDFFGAADCLSLLQTLCSGDWHDPDSRCPSGLRALASQCSSSRPFHLPSCWTSGFRCLSQTSLLFHSLPFSLPHLQFLKVCVSSKAKPVTRTWAQMVYLHKQRRGECEMGRASEVCTSQWAAAAGSLGLLMLGL